VVAKRDGWISPEEYLRIDRESPDVKYEYVDGRIYAMAGGTIDHGQICTNLTALLYPSVQDRCRLFSNVRLQTPGEQYFYPDITVSCNSLDWQGRGREDTFFSPCLIIEVLSPRSTESYDRREKFTYYQEFPTLQEYVLINTRRQLVEVYRRQGAKWDYQKLGPDEELELVTVGLSSIPVAALYKLTEVPVKPQWRSMRNESR
jgi:Uma2 family endonuclease